MESADKNCPHCGYALADGATVCPCGLSLEDIDVPAPGIVRDSLEQKLTLKKSDDVELEGIEIEDLDVDELDPAIDFPEPDRKQDSRPARPEPSAGGAARRNAESSAPRRNPDRTAPIEGRRETKEHEGAAVSSGAAREQSAVRSRPADKPSPLKPVRDAAGQPRKNLIMACPSCRARISKRAPKCPKCGQPPYRSCQICAALIMVNSGACGECGDPDPFLAQSA